MAKGNYKFVGLTYDTVKTDVNLPNGALVTQSTAKGAKAAFSDYTLKVVPIRNFEDMVSNGEVADMLFKDGELRFKVLGKDTRKAVSDAAIVGVNAGIISGGALAGHAAAAAGSAAAIETAAGGTLLLETAAAGTATAVGTTAAIAGEAVAAEVVGTAVVGAAATAGTAVAETAVVTGAGTAVAAGSAAGIAASVGSALAAAGTAVAGAAGTVLASPALPFALVGAASLALITGGTGILAGIYGSDKVYSNTLCKYVSKHIEMADKDPKTIAMCVSMVGKKKDKVIIHLHAYGSGLIDYVKTLLTQFPALTKFTGVPASNTTTLIAPLGIVTDSRFQCGYSLLFDTHIVHDDVWHDRLVKHQGVKSSVLRELSDKLDAVTADNLAKLSNSHAGENINAYCKKYNINPDDFAAGEAQRLCEVLHCDMHGLEAQLGRLL